MSACFSQRDRAALARELSSSEDDDDDVCNAELDESDDEEDILERTEDDHPELKEVVGCRKTGKRHNSPKGFINTLHKETFIHI